MLDQFIQYLPQIKNCIFFSSLDSDVLEQLLHCTGAEVQYCEKNRIVLPLGQIPERFVVVLSGQLKTVYNRVGEQRNMAEKLTPSQSVALAYCILKTPLHMHVVAAQNSVLLTLDYQKLISPCAKRCPAHAHVSAMIPMILAGKAIALSEKTDYMQMCSLRSALVSYLLSQMYKTGRLLFVSSLNQTELADFLGVSRGALSRELASLRAQGLIEYDLHTYKILNVEGLQSVGCAV